MSEFITKKGLEKLRAELDELLDVKRPEVASRIKDAVAFGDLSENAEYSEAKDAQVFIEGRISEIGNTIRNAKLVSSGSGSSSMVNIGCLVHLASSGQKREFKIVGKAESNPALGHISSDSPIGKALLGRTMGEVIEVPTPAGNKKFKIVKIA